MRKPVRPFERAPEPSVPPVPRTHRIEIETTQHEPGRWSAKLAGEASPQWGRTELEAVEHAFLHWTQLHCDAFDTGRITEPPPAAPDLPDWQKLA